MASKKHVVSRKTKKSARSRRPGRQTKTLKGKEKVKGMGQVSNSPHTLQEPIRPEPHVREQYIVTVENIRGETAIGDLLVTFPHTRDVLVKKGLKLEAEDAGDIYMTLDAFSAMNGLQVVSLVEEIVQVARDPPHLPLTQIIVAPTP